MLTVRAIPCLLLTKRKLVKTVKFKNPAYIGDPINAIKIYNEKEVDELMVLDITASAEGREPDFAMIAELTGECFMPLAYGGGVSKMEHLYRLFKMGIEKVSLNSHAAQQPGFLTHAAAEFGRQSLIFSMDVRKGFLGRYDCFIRGGSQSVGKNPVELAKSAEDAGAGEILLTSIDRDGTWEGYDIDLIRMVTDSVSIPVIASGGAGTLDHFGAAVHQGGASAVAAGSMVVYQKKGMGVLINFPKREALTTIFESRWP
jgi:imidazole glycerol-phosphate synthase subunit HisF